VAGEEEEVEQGGNIARQSDVDGSEAAVADAGGEYRERLGGGGGGREQVGAIGLETADEQLVVQAGGETTDGKGVGRGEAGGGGSGEEQGAVGLWKSATVETRGAVDEEGFELGIAIKVAVALEFRGREVLVSRIEGLRGEGQERGEEEKAVHDNEDEEKN